MTTHALRRLPSSLISLLALSLALCPRPARAAQLTDTQALTLLYPHFDPASSLTGRKAAEPFEEEPELAHVLQSRERAGGRELVLVELSPQSNETVEAFPNRCELALLKTGAHPKVLARQTFRGCGQLEPDDMQAGDGSVLIGLRRNYTHGGGEHETLDLFRLAGDTLFAPLHLDLDAPRPLPPVSSDPDAPPEDEAEEPPASGEVSLVAQSDRPADVVVQWEPKAHQKPQRFVWTGSRYKPAH